MYFVLCIVHFSESPSNLLAVHGKGYIIVSQYDFAMKGKHSMLYNSSGHVKQLNAFITKPCFS